MIEFALPVLGVGWGVLIATPLVRRARKAQVAARIVDTSLAPAPRRQRRLRPAVLGPVGRVIGGLMRGHRERRENDQFEAELPIALDLLVLAVGAGAPPQRAVEIAAAWAPATVRVPLRRVLATAELGGSFTDALEDMARTTPVLAPIADVLVASARLGAPAAMGLTRLADHSRAHLRRKAEARARTLPVKLLFPLVFLVLPAFGLLTVAPAVISALQRL